MTNEEADATLERIESKLDELLAELQPRAKRTIIQTTEKSTKTETEEDDEHERNSREIVFADEDIAEREAIISRHDSQAQHNQILADAMGYHPVSIQRAMRRVIEQRRVERERRKAAEEREANERRIAEEQEAKARADAERKALAEQKLESIRAKHRTAS